MPHRPEITSLTRNHAIKAMLLHDCNMTEPNVSKTVKGFASHSAIRHSIAMHPRSSELIQVSKARI
jgi:hypothetical protein